MGTKVDPVLVAVGVVGGTDEDEGGDVTDAPREKEVRRSDSYSFAGGEVTEFVREEGAVLPVLGL